MKVNNSAQVVLDAIVGDEINVVSLPGILSDAVCENENVLDFYIDTNQNLSEEEQDAMSIPVDGEELMEISVLSEEGLIETSVMSEDYLASHRIDDVSEPTEDFVGANDLIEEVVNATSDHEEDLYIPFLP